MVLKTNNCTEFSSMLQFIAHKVPFASLLIVFSVLTVLLNSTLIVSFVATRQIAKNTSNILIFCTSLCDLFSGLIFMPLSANILLDLSSTDLCVKLNIIVLVGGIEIVSGILTILLAIDRYFHMNPQLHNHPPALIKMFKRPHIFYVIGFVFVASESLCLVSLFHSFENGIRNFAISCATASFMAILILTTVALYTKGYLRIRNFTDNNIVYRESGETPEYVRSLYKTVLALVLLVCVHQIPYFGLRLTMAILSIFNASYDDATVAFAFEFTTLLMYAESFTNSMVVLSMNKNAKDWVLIKVRRHHVFIQDG